MNISDGQEIWKFDLNTDSVINYVPLEEQLNVESEGVSSETDSPESIAASGGFIGEELIEEVKNALEAKQYHVAINKLKAYLKDNPEQAEAKQLLHQAYQFLYDNRSLINDSLFYFTIQENSREYDVMIYAENQEEDTENVISACSAEDDPVYFGDYQVIVVDKKNKQMSSINIGDQFFNTNHDYAMQIDGTDNMFMVSECQGSEISLSNYFMMSDGQLIQLKTDDGRTDFFISHELVRGIGDNLLQTALYSNCCEITGWVFYTFEVDAEQGIIKYVKSFHNDKPVQEDVYWQWLREEYTPR